MISAGWGLRSAWRRSPGPGVVCPDQCTQEDDESSVTEREVVHTVIARCTVGGTTEEGRSDDLQEACRGSVGRAVRSTVITWTGERGREEGHDPESLCHNTHGCGPDQDHSGEESPPECCLGVVDPERGEDEEQGRDHQEHQEPCTETAEMLRTRIREECESCIPERFTRDRKEGCWKEEGSDSNEAIKS